MDQNSQGMMLVDHLIEAVAKEIGGGGHMNFKNSQKQAPSNINVGVLNIGNDPEILHSCGFQGFIKNVYLAKIDGGKSKYQQNS